MAAIPTISTDALDPLDILNSLADSCGPGDDDVFWVLTSAAAHLNGYEMYDGQGSTMAALFGKRLSE